MIRICSIALLLLVSSGVCLFGQSYSCTQNLVEAQIKYYNGQFDEVYALVMPCLLNQDLTKSEKIRIYEMLIVIDQFRRDDPSADEHMSALLKTEHEYVPMYSSTPEYISLYNSYRTRPIFSVGFKIGGFKNKIIPKTVSGTYNLTSDFKPNYETELEFHIGASFDYTLQKSFTLNGEIFWSVQNVSNWLNHTILPDLLPSRSATNIQSEFVTVTEKQQWLQIPLSLQYDFLKGHLKPYVGIGLAIEYLLNAEIVADDSRRIVEIDSGLGRVYFDGYNLNDQRNRFLVAPTFEVGIKFKMGEGYLTANYRLVYGVMDVGDQKVSYNTPSIWELSYANDIYRKNQSAINIGYLFNVYNPKKLSK